MHSAGRRHALLDYADLHRVETNRRLDPASKSRLAQFMTPAPIAEFMASMFTYREMPSVRLLDPGAGVGSLTAALVQEHLQRQKRPSTIACRAYELDGTMTESLHFTLAECRRVCRLYGVRFSYEVFRDDFIKCGVSAVQPQQTLLSGAAATYTHCIMNPPYKKIGSHSEYRHLLRRAGIETSNTYAAFFALAIRMLEAKGEIVAILPRSFCNGPYFRPFRRLLFAEAALTRLHVFEMRDDVFRDDEVLQENIIVHAIRGAQQGDVTVTSTAGLAFDSMTSHQIPFSNLVHPDDPDLVLNVLCSRFDQQVARTMSHLNHSLDELGIGVCTGPVVDFRLRSHILADPAPESHPLIYPSHMQDHRIVWPLLEGKKPNAIRESDSSRRWLMPNGWYTLTKRFSSKEEPRRIVAAVHDPACVPGDRVGFENHLNVFHSQHHGLDPAIAKGLAVYLNATLVDLHFRQWSGHTQVNASDLRRMRYPSAAMLAHLGTAVGVVFPGQCRIDIMLQEEIGIMEDSSALNPTEAVSKLREARDVLKSLGLPRGQINDRSAYALLALLNLEPGMSWSEASNPRIGITPIMGFVRDKYGKDYAPNTRETFRKESIHQFLAAAIVVQNPDQPDRPINSPKWCYQIEGCLLKLLRSYGTPEWLKKLSSYLSTRPTLAERYEAERNSVRIELVVNEGAGTIAQLSAGPHSELIKAIIDDFGPYFAPGGEVLYVGDTGNKTVVYDEHAFQELGLEFESRGKFPDVVLHDKRREWLFLIEAVTSVGPVDPKRRAELGAVFAGSKAPIVYVTAFFDRQTMAKYLSEIGWETEVWVADSPTHLIHFDGDRFLGPYSSGASAPQTEPS